MLNKSCRWPLKNNVISEKNLGEIFLKSTPLIDVRAPVEFEEGALPNSMNLPILNNQEREIIGTTYKQKGQAEAIRLGYEMVSGSIKEIRVNAWKSAIEKNPGTVVYCFRGGKRSQITQAWLKEVGIDVPIIEKGYKSARNFLSNTIENFSQKSDFLLISGPTGSGKSKLLQKIKDQLPALDLETFANHRGSAFGSYGSAQPTQINFENSLAVEMLKIKSANRSVPVMAEDESRLIGKCIIPSSMFEKLRMSPVIWIDEPVQNRVQNIFDDYILNSDINSSDVEKALAVFQRYKASLNAISKKLGGLRTKEVMDDLLFSEKQFMDSKELSSNKVWIEKLLVYYYDPLYLGSLERRQVSISFKGNWTDCLGYLQP